MQFVKLILRNALRHKLRTGLTMLGLVVAILAFGLLQTVVDAWYAGAEGAAPNRLITRNAISLTFPMPLHYREKIRGVEGVRAVGAANWFGGIYQDPKNFFPQFAIDPAPYFAMYPEYRVTEDGAARVPARSQGRGDRTQARGDLRVQGRRHDPAPGHDLPGHWSFTVRAIYDGAEAKTDTSQMFFHWDYVNETIKAKTPRRADQVGVFVVQIDDPARSAEIAQAIDRQFVNSLAETRTETEKAFQLGFVAMTEAIVVAIRIVSFVVIFIILAVMANTMAMTARERLGEYATLKALGFGPGYVARLVLGESVAIALAGAALGIAATFPVSAAFAAQMGTLFPVFEVSGETVALQIACAAVVGVAAGLLPATARRG